MTHTDAWTGREIEGQAAIVQTTEGPQVVDIHQVRVRVDIDQAAADVAVLAEGTAEQIGALTARVEELEQAVTRLTEDRDAPAPEPSTEEPAPGAKGVSTRKAATK